MKSDVPVFAAFERSVRSGAKLSKRREEEAAPAEKMERIIEEKGRMKREKGARGRGGKRRMWRRLSMAGLRYRV